MVALEKSCAVATRYIRSLRGGSQPILAEASDGHTYVIKFADNLQGPYLSFNESMGSELYRACGLPVSTWAPLRVTDSFLDRNPACWSETPEGRHRPAPGICFGSRCLASEGTTLFEILPGSYFQRVSNASDFWLAWILDFCAEHADNRQAIFCEQGSGLLNAVFVDFGHMFGGASGRQQTPRAISSRYRDERIYPDPTEAFLLSIRKIIAAVDFCQLLRRVSVLPDVWKSDSALQNFTRCLGRLADSAVVAEAFDIIFTSRRATANSEFSSHNGRKPPATILRPSLPFEATNRLAMLN